MFQFPACPPVRLWIHLTVIPSSDTGFPHSDIHGSKPACGSPWLFAACHVLLRRMVPGHPPCALCSLIFSSLFFLRPIDSSGSFDPSGFFLPLIRPSGLTSCNWPSFLNLFSMRLSRCVQGASPEDDTENVLRFRIFNEFPDRSLTFFCDFVASLQVPPSGFP